MKIDVFLSQVEQDLEAGRLGSLRVALRKREPVDLAVVADQMKEEFLPIFLELLLLVEGAEAVLSETGDSVRNDFIAMARERRPALMKGWLDKIDVDDRARILAEAPEELRPWLLESLSERERERTSRLLLYEEKTAGRIMTTEFLSAPPHAKVDEAFDLLRRSPRAEMVYYFYVTDEGGKLLGVVSLRDIIKSDRAKRLDEIMTSEVVKAEVGSNREEVANWVERYNLSAIPVVDGDNVMRGLITVDDVIDVTRTESSEDILKLAGTSEGEFDFRSPLKGFWIRLPWLCVLFAGGFLAVQSMDFFSSRLSQIVVLSFIPIIAGMGGNVGSQASTVIVRGLAVGKILKGQLTAVFFKELGTGALLGLFFGLLLASFAWLQFSQVPLLSLLAGGGIAFSIVSAATLGSLMPVLLGKMGVDPAVSTGPFVTTAIDNICLLGYLGMAFYLFG